MKEIELKDIKTVDFDYIIIDFYNIVSIEKSFFWLVKDDTIFAKTQKNDTVNNFKFLKQNKLDYRVAGSCIQIANFIKKYISKNYEKQRKTN